MRRTTCARTIALTALTLLLAGCGTPGGSEAGSSGTASPSSPGPPASSPLPSPPSSSSPPPSPSPSSAPPTPPPSSSPPGRGCATAQRELGAADTGHTFCLAAGDTIRVLLDGTTPRPWQPVTRDGSGLEPTSGGIVHRAGDASAAYRAVSAGTVRLTSSRPLCPHEPGRISCGGLQEWTVTVVVTRA
ncbi:hypothetical protein [Streptomyces sp. NBC_01497]|uniref:hypothetical protein n=1 Tax=Streptomyces sp. NBC_01497 TaxID=2903885 RepID=UPI002E306725|nr:hypothetical protein [Streptomyces sp. NBC_01497]